MQVISRFSAAALSALALSVVSASAWADGAPGASPFGASPFGGGRDGFSPLIPAALIFVVIYFMMIRPNQKRAKVHQAFLVGLKRGDMVVTNGGIIGTIKTVSDKFVTLEVDNNVHLKMLRSQVAESAAALNKEDDKEKAKS